jgi:hypothetical protein
MKPGAPSLQSTHLLDQVRERVPYLHYSLKTEKAYLYWIRLFIRWSAIQPGGMRHPRDMGVADVEAFLSMLANERKVPAFTRGLRAWQLRSGLQKVSLAAQPAGDVPACQPCLGVQHLRR